MAIRKADKDELSRMRRKLDSITGSGAAKVTHRPDSLSINVPTSQPGTTSKDSPRPLLKITSNATGNAIYNAVEVTRGTFDFTGSTNFAGTQLGTDGAACLAINTLEQPAADSATNTPTHSLAVGTYWPGDLLQTNSAGVRVYLVTAQQFGCTST